MEEQSCAHHTTIVQNPKKVPYGIKLFQWFARDRNRLYRGHALMLTFLVYTTYHLSRKPISVVKGTLNKNCTGLEVNSSGHCPAWAPFNSKEEGKELLGALDLGFLFSYAAGMYCSGYLAEHLDIRHFLTFGMVSTGFFTALFGLGYFWKIHNLAFFLAVQIFAGFVQSSGWPSVVECVGNWFGKGRRGLIMGIWNSHTSVGNILGSTIAGIWSGNHWGWSFIVPGLIIAGMGIVVHFFLVVDPAHVGCSPPQHHSVPSRKKRVRVDVHDDDEEAETASLLKSAVEIQPTPVEHGAHGADAKAINFCRAILIPGVIEYSLCLFFAKLVSYTFLFWLPFYIENTKIGGVEYSAEKSADLSAFFDLGGIIGGIIAGVISDKTGCSGITVVVMLILGGPMLFIYRFFANSSVGLNIGLMFLSGLLVNGPYALITTAVSANLGTHDCLQGDTKAMATVTAIIDGTGSLGAALGPLLTGIISPTGWNNVFYMLMAADVFAALLMVRQVWIEVTQNILSKTERPKRPSRISVAHSAYDSQSYRRTPSD